MSRAHTLLLESISASAHEVLAHNEITVRALPGALAASELIEAVSALPAGAPKVIGLRSKTKAYKEVLEQLPDLAAIGAFCIGTDQVDLEYARQHGVAVFNAPFSSTRSVAELVLGEVVMLARQIIPRNRAAHEGTWAKSSSGSHEVRGKTLGIIGYGHIGSQVSVLAESLGLNVIYHDIVPKLPLGNATPAGSLGELLRQSDFVTLHVPRSELTRYMIGKAELAEMKQGACLLNLSRGDVVEIEPLRDALVEGRLAGAAIDVYPKEPKRAGEDFDSPLRNLDNVILTPHIGGSTLEAQTGIGVEVANALVRFLRDGTTTGAVNLPEVEPPARHPNGYRIWNAHQNVPGVLSNINRLVADAGANIVGQNLATREDIGVLVVDVTVPDLAAAKGLTQAIADLSSSVRTRLLP